MQAIVAVDQNYAIGYRGGMLFHLPEDLKYFARMTRGKTLVMGRATLQSFPNGKPLPGRPHIVLSRDKNFAVPGASVVHSLRELREAIAPYAPDQVFLVGGGQLYSLLIDCCDTAYVTRVRAKADEADCRFPNLDERPGWRLAEESEPVEDNGFLYTHCRYENSNVFPIESADQSI